MTKRNQSRDRRGRQHLLQLQSIYQSQVTHSYVVTSAHSIAHWLRIISHVRWRCAAAGQQQLITTRRWRGISRRRGAVIHQQLTAPSPGLSGRQISCSLFRRAIIDDTSARAESRVTGARSQLAHAHARAPAPLLAITTLIGPGSKSRIVRCTWEYFGYYT